jgi:rhodanese-related sulfurtransferase
MGDGDVKKLLPGIGLGILTWLLVTVGVSDAMAPMQDQHRQQAVQELYENYRKNFPDVHEVTPEEAIKLQQAGQAVFVDVRPLLERRVSALPGAIAASDFLKCPDSYQGKTLIAYDTVGYRSGLFAEQMRRKDIDMANLQGGLLGWLYAGGKIFDGAGRETRRVHIYGCMWNYAPGGCEVVR